MIYAPVPSSSLKGKGRPGIRTQAPKKKPKGVFGNARPAGAKPKPSGPPASRFGKGKSGGGGKSGGKSGGKKGGGGGGGGKGK
jgi:hypothetical protein